MSAGKSGLAIAVRYAARRRQFRAGPGADAESPLLDYPTHRRRLMPLLANTYALDFAHKHLVRRKVAADAPAPGESERAALSREVELLAAGLKAYLTWNTTRTLQVCREACGGEGFISANRLPALKSDTDIFTTFEGDNTVLMLWIGRNLLAREPGTAAMAVAEDHARVEPATDTLRSSRSLFQTRERVMLDRIRSDIGRSVAAGLDAQAATSSQQLALFHAAHAYVERVVLDCFIARIAACESTDFAALTPPLRRLAELFALSLLEQHRGWHLENAYLTPAESRSLTGRIDDLCAELAPDAVALVDAFGIPDQCLAAPIAFG